MSFSVRRIRTEPPRRRFPWRRAALTVLTFARPLLGWYEAWKHRQEEEHRMTVLKRTLLVLVAIFCALLLLAGTAKALLGIRSLGLKTLVAVTGGELPVDANGHTNLLLLGQGDASHDGRDLTDTIMVVSIDPSDTKSVVALSLPRDLYFLSTEKMGKGRLNSLYRDYKGYLRGKGVETPDASQEAMRELAAEIGRTLGVAIHGTVKVDFQGFVDTVDVLGGIDIDVPEDIVDTEYPDEQYGFETFSVRKGIQHLDGATALKYVRSRHASSDFDRSARQQQVLLAIAEKAKTEKLHRDIGAITDLLQILAEHVETTLTMREVIALAGTVEALDRSRVVTMQLNDQNGLYGTLASPGGLLYAPPRDLFGGASVLLPVSIPEYPVNWKQMRTLSRLLFDMRSAYIADPTIAIVNAGARSGSARVLGGELIRYGFNVEHIANAETLPEQEHAWIAENTTDAPVTEFFATLLKLPVEANGGMTPVEQRTVTIVLGKDYRYEPLQDLLPAP